MGRDNISEIVDQLESAINTLVSKKGWREEDIYLHGRAKGKKFGESLDYPTLFSQDVFTAAFYGGDNEIWAVYVPKGKYIDFSYTHTKDMTFFISKIDAFRKKDFSKFNLDKEQITYMQEIFIDVESSYRGATGISGKIEDKAFYEYIRSVFCPEDIVETAEAYDSYDIWMPLLLLYTDTFDYPNFIKTPDGGVVLPGRMKHLNPAPVRIY